MRTIFYAAAAAQFLVSGCLRNSPSRNPAATDLTSTEARQLAINWLRTNSPTLPYFEVREAETLDSDWPFHEPGETNQFIPRDWWRVRFMLDPNLIPSELSVYVNRKDRYCFG